MTKTLLIAVFAVLLLTGAVFAQGPYFRPFMQKATEPITVDCDLSEWNYCFRYDFNQESIPETSRSRNWWPEDNWDCSGTLMLMWDDDYLYFAAKVQDDVPAVYNTNDWRGDVLELYIANYDIGDVPGPWEDDATTYYDTDTGDFAVQFGFFYDGDEDTTAIKIWQPAQVAGMIKNENSFMLGELWDSGEGYTIEGKVLWADFVSPNTGNIFELEEGMIIPCTVTLYDVDEYVEYDFDGYCFDRDGFNAPWGVGKGWHSLEVKGEREGPWYQFSSPYIKQAKAPITVDAEFDDWAYAFPIDMNQEAFPEDSRCRGWWPEDNWDLSGTIRYMYDEEYLYLAAEIQDDVPAIMVDPFGWRSDVIELYISNYDMGEMMAELSGSKGVSGDHAEIQLAFYYNGDEDTTEVWTYDPAEASLKSDLTVFKGKLGDDGESWMLEGKLNLEELNDYIDPTGVAYYDFAYNEGGVLPCTHSLYDVDEYVEYDFDGYQAAVGAPHEGPGSGSWYGIEVVGTCLLEELDWLWDNYNGVETAKLDRVPEVYQLKQNYPNPFNPVTTIEFDLVSAGTVSLNIFNVRGELVRTIFNNEFKSPGVYTAKVDMSDSPSGVYFYVLEQGDAQLVQKMMLMK